MKHLIRFLAVLCAALGFCSASVSSAEAASVALLPLINNVQEEDNLSKQIYFKQAIAAINAQKEFTLVENDKLTAAIDAAKITNAVPDEATLAKIAMDGDVDIVIAMQLDVLDDKAIRSSEGDTLKLDLEGYAVAYNRLSGEYYKHRIYDDKEIPEAFSSRWDWTHEEWGNNVRREINRILQVKKIIIDKPRISKL